MRVLMAGVGNPPPTFIRRRIQALSREGIEVWVPGIGGGEDFGRDLRIRGLWVPKRAWPGLLRLGFGALRRPMRFARMAVPPGGNWKRTLVFLSRHSYLFWLGRIDLIHVQWIAGTLPWQRVADAIGVPLVASVRGSQVTVKLREGKPWVGHIRECLQAADVIHCVSKDLARVCSEMGAKERMIRVVYNGVDLELFRPENDAKPPTEFTAVTVGALIPRKNLSHLLLVIDALRKKGLRLRLRMVGDGEERVFLLHAAEKLGLGAQVEFLGRRSEEEIAAILRKAHLYLSTSMAEGLANSCVEAAASGLPIVAYDCEGMAEVVKQEETGVVVPFGDVGAMVAAIQRLYTDENLRKRMGAAARRHAERHFSLAECTQAMICLYREALEKGRCPSQVENASQGY